MPEQSTPVPRVAIVVADKTYRDVLDDHRRVHLLDAPDWLIVPYSAKPVVQFERVVAVREQLISRDLMAIDQLLIRNPYDVAAYEFADDAIETFVKAKYYLLASIAAHLGAASIKFVKVNAERKKSQTDGRFMANAKVAIAGGEFARSIEDRLESHFEAETELAGKPADIEEARRFVLEHRLSNDPDVTGLIDLCAAGNPLRAHRVKINGIRESTQTFKVGLELTTQLNMKLGGSGMFTRAAESISSIEITTEITWPKG